MIVNPIIPIWLMAIICVALLIVKHKGIWPYIRQIIIIALLFVINLRIMIATDDVKIETQDIDANILFVIDNTISMVAVDCEDETERLEALKDDCSYIVDELHGARFAVMTFANRANLVMPYTDNVDFAKDTIDCITVVDELLAKGSSMNVSKDMMIKILERDSEKEDGKTYVFFISDGEITNDDELDSFAEIAEYIDGGAVFGYGTEEGGKMYVSSYWDDEKTVLEESYGKAAISKIDEDNLKSIASDMAVDYINMTDSDEIDEVIDKIVKDAKITDGDGSTEGYADIYYIFVIPLLLLLIYEFIDLKNKLKMN